MFALVATEFFIIKVTTKCAQLRQGTQSQLKARQITYLYLNHHRRKTKPKLDKRRAANPRQQLCQVPLKGEGSLTFPNARNYLGADESRHWRYHSVLSHKQHVTGEERRCRSSAPLQLHAALVRRTTVSPHLLDYKSLISIYTNTDMKIRTRSTGC